jgi:hypothetical protein
MKRLILATALGAVVAVGGTAQAAHKPNHAPKTPKCTVKKAFTVKGVLAAGSTVTATGVQAIDVTRANSHARKAGYGPDTTEADSANDPGTYELPAGKTVKLRGYEESETPAEGDKVRVLGKIAYDRCGESKDGDAKGYEGDPVIRKIQVIDSDDEA